MAVDCEFDRSGICVKRPSGVDPVRRDPARQVNDVFGNLLGLLEEKGTRLFPRRRPKRNWSDMDFHLRFA
jgi:hypothetical protein